MKLEALFENVLMAFAGPGNLCPWQFWPGKNFQISENFPEKTSPVIGVFLQMAVFLSVHEENNFVGMHRQLKTTYIWMSKSMYKESYFYKNIFRKTFTSWSSLYFSVENFHYRIVKFNNFLITYSDNRGFDNFVGMHRQLKTTYIWMNQNRCTWSHIFIKKYIQKNVHQLKFTIFFCRKLSLQNSEI